MHSMVGWSDTAVLDQEEGSLAGCGFDVGALPHVQFWVRCRTDGKWRMPHCSSIGQLAPQPVPVRTRFRRRMAEQLCLLLIGAVLACVLSMSAHSATILTDLAKAPGEAPLTAEFQLDVSPIFQLPEEERLAYAARLQAALNAAQLSPAAAQYILLVDRSASVQAALLYWGSAAQGWVFVGATPVSTGWPGRYEHFTTPLGVFDHSPSNPDFRAEGTKNKLGFRGYGVKGMRIYDFGWVKALRGWGDHSMGVLRLQMHATDPDLAAPRLGTAQSEGCVRIPASLNAFIDRHGLLDAAYEEAVDAGAHLWVLRVDRTPTPYAGRYLEVVDSEREERPTWSPLPARH
jgi:hypothetical protein